VDAGDKKGGDSYRIRETVFFWDTNEERKVDKGSVYTSNQIDEYYECRQKTESNITTKAYTTCNYRGNTSI
jgi:hypothetical protein